MKHARFSVCIATYGRLDALQNTLRSLYGNLDPDEVVVAVDGCRDTWDAIPSLKCQFPSIQFVGSASRRGPGIAKDTAIRQAVNRYILVIDDDIEFYNVNCVENVLSALNQYALIQNLILDETGTGIRSNEYPAMWRKRKGKFEISYFVGAIHWLDRDAYRAVGGYSDFEGYGFEELSLSIRLIRNGMKLLFWDCVSIVHFQSPMGRRSGQEVSRSMTHNRLVIARKYFPKVLSALQVAWWAGRHWILYREWITTPPHVVREPLMLRELVRRPRLLARAFW